MSEQHLIVVALIRRGNEILLVRAQGADDPEPVWMLPGGVVEAGELAVEALMREVREETGLEIDTLERLLYVAQFDNPAPIQLHESRPGGTGYTATTLVFEVRDWHGEMRLSDPDHLVSFAEFVSPPEAIARLARLPFRVMREPLIAYLRGQADAGTVWLYRRDPDGSDNLILRAGTEHAQAT